MLFEIDPEPATETLTALGGIPLLGQALRSLGVPGSVKRQVRSKQRQGGYDEPTRVESCVILNAAGGEARATGRMDGSKEGGVSAGTRLKGDSLATDLQGVF